MVCSGHHHINAGHWPELGAVLARMRAWGLLARLSANAAAERQSTRACLIAQHALERVRTYIISGSEMIMDTRNLKFDRFFYSIRVRAQHVGAGHPINPHYLRPPDRAPISNGQQARIQAHSKSAARYEF
jgi:hypothetical protein